MTVLQIKEFDQYRIDPDRFIEDGRLNVRGDVQRYFDFRFNGGYLVIQPKGWIGVIPLKSDLSVEVQPRIQSDISRMLELSGVVPTMLSDIIRGYRRQGNLIPALIHVYAEALEYSTRNMVKYGFLREYRRIEQITSTPTGRILAGQTISRVHSRGQRHKAVISRFERTTDVQVNRLIVASAYALQAATEWNKESLGSEIRRVHQILNVCLLRLSGIKHDIRQEFRGDPLVTGRLKLPSSKSHYESVLSLSKAILDLSGVALDEPRGPIEMPSMVLEMWRVFEGYIRRLLEKAFADKELPIEVLDGNEMAPVGGGMQSIFETGVPRPATPDVVFRWPNAPHGHPLVVDVQVQAD